MSLELSQATVVCGAFDDIRSRHLRFLQEAARLGPLHVLLWSDELVNQKTGAAPKFPYSERRYFLEAVRYVRGVSSCQTDQFQIALGDSRPKAWVRCLTAGAEASVEWCSNHGVHVETIEVRQLSGYPLPPAPAPQTPGRKKVVVTGCYDWFHSGHVRFCEEVSSYGDLYVVLGHDANIRLLKGEGHPLLRQEERCYVVSSIKYVTQALISSGEGWLDADPEIKKLKPDIYAVNEDGDKGGKREYCAKMGIEYLVLKRTPAPGLPRRSSTDLRGF